MNILMFILSLVMIIVGIICISLPMMSFMTIGWIIGIVILFVGIFQILRYATGRQDKSKFDLICGILGIVVSGLLLFNEKSQFIASMTIIYILAIWLLLKGICEIIDGIKLKKLNDVVPDDLKTPYWLIIVVIGIVTILIGIVCMIKPVVTAMSVGTLIGIAIVISGCENMAISFYGSHKVN